MGKINKKTSALIVIPAYNEAQNIERVVDELIHEYPQYDYIIINDCSTDDTKEVCEKKNYNILNLPLNTGLGTVVQTGFKYALRNNEFKKVYTKKGHMMLNGVTVRSTIHAGGAWIGLNTDRILGGKTGYTDEAGTCISVLFKSNGHDMLLITLKAPFVKNQNYHIKDALALIDYTDINFGDQVIVEKDTLIDKIKVKLSTTDNYNIKSTKDITKYLSNDYDKSKISYEYTGATEILYNFKKGDELGKISYYYDGELVTNEFVVLTEELKPDIVEIFDTYKTQILILAFSSVFGIITILILLRKSLA